jgi:hypothetical protein
MAFHFQNDKRFADGRPRYAEAFGKIPFRRQALAFGQFPAFDEQTNLFRDQPVKAARLQSHKHDTLPARKSPPIAQAVRWSYQFY